ncbi:tyrosine-type recombinase/integrase [Inquilinus sp.]|uniref:tyrosine-type recombinase/integrase n=1 Tax=Inquilinus sp. TaxID=1932117 RepID=UPI003783D09D
MRATITKATVEKAKPAEKDIFIWDDKLAGFGVKVTPTGSKVYLVQYREGQGVGAPIKRVTIGRHGEPWKAETAREEAERILAGVKLGQRRAGEKHRKRRSRKTAGDGPVKGSVAHAFEQYDVKALSKLRSGGEIKRTIEKDVIPVWGEATPLVRIGKAELLDVRTRIVEDPERNAATMADLTLRRARTFLRWSAAAGLIEEAPGQAIRATAKRRRRKRTHTEAELRLVWLACDRLADTAWRPYAKATQTLMILAQRRDEVGTMEWSELHLDSDDPHWLIPPEKAKNEEGHIVHLPDLAVDLLRSMPRLVASGGKPSRFVFTSTGNRPLNGWSHFVPDLHAMIRTVQVEEAIEAGIDPETVPTLPAWVLHDLRRSFVSGLARLKVAPHVADRVLNHVGETFDVVQSTYNVHEYGDERREAMYAWSQRLTAIIEGKPNNAIEMTRLAG